MELAYASFPFLLLMRLFLLCVACSSGIVVPLFWCLGGNALRALTNITQIVRKIFKVTVQKLHFKLTVQQNMLQLFIILATFETYFGVFCFPRVCCITLEWYTSCFLIFHHFDSNIMSGPTIILSVSLLADVDIFHKGTKNIQYFWVLYSLHKLLSCKPTIRPSFMSRCGKRILFNLQGFCVRLSSL